MSTAGQQVYYRINNGTMIMINDGPPPEVLCVGLLGRFGARVNRKGWIYVGITVALAILLLCILVAFKTTIGVKYFHPRHNVLTDGSKFGTSFPSSTNAFSVNSGTSKNLDGNHEDEMLSTLKEDDDNVDAIPTTLIPETKDDEKIRILDQNNFPALHTLDKDNSNESSPVHSTLRMLDQNYPNKSSPVTRTLHMHDQNDPNESSPVTRTLRMHDQNDPNESSPVTRTLHTHDQNDPNKSSPVTRTLHMHDQNDPNESFPVTRKLHMDDQNDPNESSPVTRTLHMHDQNDPNKPSPVTRTLHMHDQNDPNKLSSPVTRTLHIHDQNDPNEIVAVSFATRIREILLNLGFLG